MFHLLVFLLASNFPCLIDFFWVLRFFIIYFARFSSVGLRFRASIKNRSVFGKVSKILLIFLFYSPPKKNSLFIFFCYPWFLQLCFSCKILHTFCHFSVFSASFLDKISGFFCLNLFASVQKKSQKSSLILFTFSLYFFLLIRSLFMRLLFMFTLFVVTLPELFSSFLFSLFCPCLFSFLLSLHVSSPQVHLLSL